MAASRKEISESLAGLLDDSYQGPTRIHREIHQKFKAGKVNVLDYVLSGKAALEKVRALKQMIGAATVRSLAVETLRNWVDASSASGQLKNLLNRWNAVSPQVRKEFFTFGTNLPECLSAIGYDNIANHLYTSGALGPQPRELSALATIFQSCSSILGD